MSFEIHITYPCGQTYKHSVSERCGLAVQDLLRDERKGAMEEVMSISESLTNLDKFTRKGLCAPSIVEVCPEDKTECDSDY